jgi:hypothetical protein
VVTPNSSNSGAATLISEAIKVDSPDLSSIIDVTNNSLSSVAYT